MPKALIADWEPVKATALATGSLKAAADAHNLSYGAVKQEAHRRKWPVGRRIKQTLESAKTDANNAVVTANPKSVTSVTSGAVAIANHLQQKKEKSRLNLAKFVVNASSVAAKSRKPLAIAQDVRHVSAVMQALWPEEGSKGLTLNLGVAIGGMQ